MISLQRVITVLIVFLAWKLRSCLLLDLNECCFKRRIEKKKNFSFCFWFVRMDLCLQKENSFSFSFEKMCSSFLGFFCKVAFFSSQNFSLQKNLLQSWENVVYIGLLPKNPNLALCSIKPLCRIKDWFFLNLIKW